MVVTFDARGRIGRPVAGDQMTILPQRSLGLQAPRVMQRVEERSE
jgi:hypothetical protein